MRDRFGDYGLVGLVIIRFAEQSAVIDSLLMSCRVLGRGIETAMLARAQQLCNERGIGVLSGDYIPSRKNGMVADLFTRHGFAVTGSEADGTVHHTIEAVGIAVPAYLSVIASAQPLGAPG